MSVAPATPIRIEFFYDIVSPYSLLALTVLRRYVTLEPTWRDRVQLTLRPFFLGGVMQAAGNQPPGALPARGAHLAKDLTRNAHFYHLRLAMPGTFPTNTLKVMRLLTAVATSSTLSRTDQQRLLMSLSLAFYAAYWQDSRDITDDNILRSVLSEQGMSSAQQDAWMCAAVTSDNKQALQRTTAVAIERGAFGAPSWFVSVDAQPDREPEMYFGSDRFEQFAMRYKLPWHGPSLQRSNVERSKL